MTFDPLLTQGGCPAGAVIVCQSSFDINVDVDVVILELLMQAVMLELLDFIDRWITYCHSNFL